MLYIIFGFPGAGKTYTGKVFAKQFGFYFYDGDESLPDDMKQAIVTQQPVSDTMRDEFFNRLLTKIKDLSKTHPNLVIAQTYIKEKYRKAVMDVFPEARFILVQTNTPLREVRLLTQNTYNLTLSYVRQMVERFEEPQIAHKKISNNDEGEAALKKQVTAILLQ